MLSEENVLELLSKSEATVYDFIKSESVSNGGSIKMSMKQIGEKVGISEATVHRAVRKLRKQGVVGIVPSVEKAESNEIIYHGIPDPDQQVSDIFQLIENLSSNANRFEAVLEGKDRELEKLKRENEQLYERIEQLEEATKKSHASSAGFDPDKIISSEPLGDGTTAYIVKN